METINKALDKSLENRELEFKIESSSPNDKVKLCPVCGDPIEKITFIPGINKYIKGPVVCKCKKEELKAKEIEEVNKEKQIRLKQIIKNSLMDEKFRKSRFETWDFDKGTRKMYNLGIKYAERFSEMKKESVGLLIYGDPGNGKTHTVACIANALIDKMVPAICVNIDGLLSRIKETYSTWGSEGEETILRGLGNADLLIIDDLGTEQDTDWAKTKIYNILDSRYRNGLPLIITTNISLEQLKEKYHARTYDRLLEMCTPVINEGKSIRVENAKEKTKLLKELLT